MTHIIELQRYNDKNELVATVRQCVTDSEWKAINYVDYLQFDARGRLMSEFDVHDFPVRARMQSY